MTKPVETTTNETNNPTGQATAEQVERVERRLTPEGIRMAREALGCSRSVIQEMTGLSGSRVWASEQADKEITDEHYLLIVAALENITTNGVPEHLKPKQRKAKTTVAVEHVQQVHELLGTALDLKSVKELKVVIEQARAMLTEMQSI